MGMRAAWLARGAVAALTTVWLAACVPPTPTPTTLAPTATPTPTEGYVAPAVTAVTALPTATPTPAERYVPPLPSPTPTPSQARTPTPSQPPTPTPSPTPVRTDLFGLPCSLPDAPEPAFSAPFVDIERVASIVPLWPVSGPLLKGHTYIHLDKSVAGDTPVYAPARALVRSIAYYAMGGVAEYMVSFSVDCNVSFFFDHLKTLSPALSAIAP